MCYVMQAVSCFNCLGDKCLSHAKLMSTALTQLLIFKFSCLLTYKGIVQCSNNSNYRYIFIYLLSRITPIFQDQYNDTCNSYLSVSYCVSVFPLFLFVPSS